jgi:hemerythrin
MKKLEWSDKLNLGVEKIDNQHQELVKLANNLLSAIQSHEAREVLDLVFKELREYTVFHFRDEEQYMEEIGFPKRGEHMIKHRELKDQVKQYQRDIYQKSEVSPSEVLEFLRGWLVDHIIYRDMEIASYIKEKKRNKPVSIGKRRPDQE